MKALIFDLDDMLTDGTVAVVVSVLATVRIAAHRFGVDPTRWGMRCWRTRRNSCGRRQRRTSASGWASGLKCHFQPENTFISGYVGLGGPHLDLFRMVLEKLSVEPREAVMIGDSIRNDVEPALACGLHAVWMRNRRRDNLSPAAVPRVDRLEELPAAIESLEVTRA